MNLDEHTNDQIDRYLNGNMTDAELIKFEQQLQLDVDLMDEVNMAKTLKSMLEDSPENELRKNLQKINEEINLDTTKIPAAATTKTTLSEATETTPSGFFDWLNNLFFSNSYRVAFILLPILVGLGWWFWNSNRAVEKDPVVVDREKINEKPMDTDVDSGNKVPEKAPDPKENKEVVDKDTSTIKEKNKNPKQQATPNKNPKPQEIPQEYFAENFDPIPTLEFLIDNNLRDSGTRLRIDKKIGNVTLSKKDDVVNFQLAGQFDSKENLASKDLKIHLFSNDKNAFENYTSIFSDALELKKKSANLYTFDNQKYISLLPGLYYYIIEDVAIEKNYLVGKFEVRLR
ncbi:MAG: hypothetical protein AAF573_01985 [Bacteroidota bacterium]